MAESSNGERRLTDEAMLVAPAPPDALLFNSERAAGRQRAELRNLTFADIVAGQVQLQRSPQQLLKKNSGLP